MIKKILKQKDHRLAEGSRYPSHEVRRMARNTDNSAIYYENIDYMLYRLLEQAMRAIRKARRKELLQYGISPRHAVLLGILYGTKGEVTVSQIAQWIILEPHTIFEALQRMEKQALIRRMKSKNTKLGKFELTPKGYELYLKACKQESIHGIMNFITKEERTQLKLILKRLRDTALQEIGEYQEFPFPPY